MASWLVRCVVQGDAIGRQRPVEFDYPMSDAFGELLQLPLSAAQAA